MPDAAPVDARTVLACVDGSIYADSVADHAAWAAGRYGGAAVEVLQAIGRREADAEDRSGRIVAGARRQLLEKLAEVDAERAKLLRERGWLDLEEAKARIEAAGVADVRTTLRHGDLLETVAERDAEARLVVVGKRGAAADFATLHLGSNLERLLRAARRPVLVAARAFRPVKRFMLAFDGQAEMLKAVDAASRSPLLQGLEGVLLTAGEDDADRRRAQEAAVAQLRAGGLWVTAELRPGPAKEVIPAAVEALGIDLLVMGAYSHSRLRTLVLGSTTAETIRSSLVPILVHR